MVQQLLEQLGFSEKEVEVYLTVLEKGKIAPSDVSKITGINRSTVYAVAKDLIKKGVITEDLGGSVRYLTALPPRELGEIIAREENELKKRKTVTTQAIQELQDFTKNTHFSIPKITFVPEEDIEKHLFKRSEIWHKSIFQHDGIWWGFEDSAILDVYKKWIEYMRSLHPLYTVRTVGYKTQWMDEVRKRKNPILQIKYLSSQKKLSAFLWILGDFIIMFATKHKPYYLVEINDVVMAENMRLLFSSMWESIPDSEK